MDCKAALTRGTGGRVLGPEPRTLFRTEAPHSQSPEETDLNPYTDLQSVARLSHQRESLAPAGTGRDSPERTTDSNPRPLAHVMPTN